MQYMHTCVNINELMKYISFTLYFSAKVKITAIQKTWILGDTFLQRIYHSYDTLRDRARRSAGKMETPYLLDAYTVSSHVMGELNGINSPAARVQNCLIRKLNTCTNMPRFIVIVVIMISSRKRKRSHEDESRNNWMVDQ